MRFSNSMAHRWALILAAKIVIWLLLLIIENINVFSTEKQGCIKSSQSPFSYLENTLVYCKYCTVCLYTIYSSDESGCIRNLFY